MFGPIVVFGLYMWLNQKLRELTQEVGKTNTQITRLDGRIDNLAAEFELLVRLTYPDHPIQIPLESHKR